MPKSVKRSHVRKSHATKSVSISCKYPATMQGLYQWYKAMFEKLGWMILVKSRGENPAKIMAYKRSLKLLEKKLECKLKSSHDADRKEDVQILLNDLQVLIKHASRDL
jgi:hypothetical protein